MSTRKPSVVTEWAVTTVTMWIFLALYEGSWHCLQLKRWHRSKRCIDWMQLLYKAQLPDFPCSHTMLTIIAIAANSIHVSSSSYPYLYRKQSWTFETSVIFCSGKFSSLSAVYSMQNIISLSECSAKTQLNL